MKYALVCSMLVGAALAAEVFECPLDETTGKFADPDECDKFWDCFRGEATATYCPDGYAFDPTKPRDRDPCDYIFNVDCRGRQTLGEPLGTGVCIRQNGIYAHEDPLVCDKYYSCLEDVPEVRDCPPGLHYNVDTHLCDWPASAQRGDCEALRSLPDGFTCDPKKQYFSKTTGLPMVHPTFPHPEDCQRFYVCKNGVLPSIGRCDEGLVFSTETSACENPEIVPDCADYYKSADADFSPRS